MCLGVPMRVMESLGHAAWCEGRGERALVDLTLVGPQPVGTWVLTHLGAAREVLTPQAADSSNAALDALAAALSGDAARIDSGFADLVGREPALPEHLRGGKD
jgi:hydrogenase expression/formation protein HypC